MKKIGMMVIGSVIALGLSGVLAATGWQPVDGVNQKPASAYSIVSFTQAANTNVVRPVSLGSNMNVTIRGFGLGAIANGVPTGSLKLASVKGAPGITVFLTGVGEEGMTDILKFYVTVNSSVTNGVYPVQVALENTLTGDNGTVTLYVDVR